MIDQAIMQAASEQRLLRCQGIGLLLRKLAKLNEVDLDAPNSRFTIGQHVDPESSVEVDIAGDSGEIVTIMFMVRRGMHVSLHESYTFIRGENE